MMPPIAKHCLFIGFKLPGMIVLIIIGFMMEFIVELPFAIMTRLDGRSRKQ